MKINIYEKKSFIIFMPMGNLNESSANRLAKELKSLRVTDNKIVFDLKHVEYITIKSLSLLAEFGKKYSDLNFKKHLRIIHVNESISNALLMHGLYKYYSIENATDNFLPCHFSY